MHTFLAAIFVFGLLIFAHEVGHYVVARLSGIRVLELAIGFGPKLLGWSKDGTNYSLRAFPLGGFCRMLGEGPEEANEPDSFNKKPIYKRAAVLAAGSLTNLLLAFVVFFIIFFFMLGVPVEESTRLGSVTPGDPADVAGLQTGDEIISVDGTKVERWEDIAAIIEEKPNRKISVLAKRDGEALEFSPVAKEVPETGRGIIGIAREMQKYNFTASVQTGLDQFSMVIGSLYRVVTGQEPLDVTGPVGIVIVVGEVAKTGFMDLLYLTAFISISLGLINLFPIPALDGGRLLFLLIEGIRGKPMDPDKEGLIHFIGFALLILLIIFVTYNDLIRWEIIPGL